MHVRGSRWVQAPDCGAPAGPSDFAAGLIRLSFLRSTVLIDIEPCTAFEIVVAAFAFQIVRRATAVEMVRLRMQSSTRASRPQPETLRCRSGP